MSKRFLVCEILDALLSEADVDGLIVIAPRFFDAAQAGSDIPDREVRHGMWVNASKLRAALGYQKTAELVSQHFAHLHPGNELAYLLTHTCDGWITHRLDLRATIIRCSGPGHPQLWIPACAAKAIIEVCSAQA